MWIASIPPYLNGSDILELGHGPGHLQINLLKNGYKSVGLDFSNFMSGAAKKNILKAGIGAFNLVYGKAQAIPFPENSFSSVVATFPSEFITERETLEGIWRVLSPSGRLVILPAAWITGSKWVERLAAWIFRITNQAPDEDLSFNAINEYMHLDLIQQIGFQVNIHLLDLESSRVLILTADKSDEAIKTWSVRTKTAG